MQPGRGTKSQDIVATVATIAVHTTVIIFLLLNLNLTASLHPAPNEVCLLYTSRCV